MRCVIKLSLDLNISKDLGTTGPVPPAHDIQHSSQPPFQYSEPFRQFDSGCPDLSFTASLNWDDPSLYFGLPPLSALLNESHGVSIPPVSSDVRATLNSSNTASVEDNTLKNSTLVGSLTHNADTHSTIDDTQVDGQQPIEGSCTMIAQHSSAAPRVDLAEANNSSWAARNPDRPVLASREPLTTAQKACAKAQRASRKITSQQRKEAEDMLNSAIQQMLAKEAQKVNNIALEHGVTVEKVKKLMGGIKNYKSSRSAQLENALMHAKAEQVNKGEFLCVILN